MGHDWGVWPVLGVMLLAICIPTGCVLWFMNRAIINERLAVRQRLTNVYQQRIDDARQLLADHWQAKADALAIDSNAPPTELFAKLIASGAAESVIILDENGDPAYPKLTIDRQDAAPQNAELWSQAEELEYELAKPEKAAEAYAKIAAATKDVSTKARALGAQARCLIKTGQNTEALKLLTQTLGEKQFAAATYADGRLIAPGAQLLGLELLGDANTAQYQQLTSLLAKRLNDYSGPPMPASQRRFLMLRLTAISKDAPDFPTLRAEQLAAEYLENVTVADTEPLQLGRVGQSDLLHMPSADRKVIAIFSRGPLLANMRTTGELDEPIPGATIELTGPTTTKPDAPKPLLSDPACDFLPGWQLEVYLEGSNPFAEAARKQNIAYAWIATLGILAIALLAAMVARYISGQMKLTRLKNDLIATVSHELKTPLASMRVLVDTLLEGRCESQGQADEYLQLIAKENHRLSRLIDNFLTFSRMERNKKAFELRPVGIDDIVTAATDAVAERFSRRGCNLTIDAKPDLPSIIGDRDALITVAVNLLDNAWKYTGDQKDVLLRSYERDGKVCIEVTDNGIGISRRDARKVFDRFYQHDKSLSRVAEGCGLGLSIVKFIVDAHGGTIDLVSSPGEGSTFTVAFPPAELASQNASQQTGQTNGK